MKTWHVAEVTLSTVRKFERQLHKLGATDIQVPVPGCVLWQGSDAWDASLRSVAGVRFIAAVGEEEIQQMGESESVSGGLGIGATVSVPCGSMHVVGRIDALEEGKATLIASLFGRAVKLTVPEGHVKAVELPEVWR
jgi:hypothetical protein